MLSPSKREDVTVIQADGLGVLQAGWCPCSRKQLLLLLIKSCYWYLVCRISLSPFSQAWVFTTNRFLCSRTTDVFLIMDLQHFSCGKKEAGTGLETGWAGCAGTWGSSYSTCLCCSPAFQLFRSCFLLDFCLLQGQVQQPYVEGFPGPD